MVLKIFRKLPTGISWYHDFHVFFIFSFSRREYSNDVLSPLLFHHFIPFREKTKPTLENCWKWERNKNRMNEGLVERSKNKFKSLITRLKTFRNVNCLVVVPQHLIAFTSDSWSMGKWNSRQLLTLKSSYGICSGLNIPMC